MAHADAAADAQRERPMASKEWAVQVGMADGTFYPARARLVQIKVVGREGEGCGVGWTLNEDGRATVRVLGIRAQRKLAA